MLCILMYVQLTMAVADSYECPVDQVRVQNNAVSTVKPSLLVLGGKAVLQPLTGRGYSCNGLSFAGMWCDLREFALSVTQRGHEDASLSFHSSTNKHTHLLGLYVCVCFSSSYFYASMCIYYFWSTSVYLQVLLHEEYNAVQHRYIHILVCTNCE